MPEPLTSYIIDIHLAAYSFSADMQNLYNQTLNLATQLAAEGNPGSSGAANNMAAQIWNMRNKFSYGTSSFRYPLIIALQWMDSNWGGGGSLTMDDLLNTLLGATFEQIKTWMGITDAYKVAIYDAPFNYEYYAALARGFRVWGI